MGLRIGNVMLGWVLAGQEEQEHFPEMSVTRSLSPLCWDKWGWGKHCPVLVQRCGTWAASLGWDLWASPE